MISRKEGHVQLTKKWILQFFNLQQCQIFFVEMSVGQNTCDSGVIFFHSGKHGPSFYADRDPPSQTMGQNGDYYVNRLDGYLYVKIKQKWVNEGPFLLNLVQGDDVAEFITISNTSPQKDKGKEGDWHFDRSTGHLWRHLANGWEDDGFFYEQGQNLMDSNTIVKKFKTANIDDNKISMNIDYEMPSDIGGKKPNILNVNYQWRYNLMFKKTNDDVNLYMASPSTDQLLPNNAHLRYRIPLEYSQDNSFCEFVLDYFTTISISPKAVIRYNTGNGAVTKVINMSNPANDHHTISHTSFTPSQGENNTTDIIVDFDKSFDYVAQSEKSPIKFVHEVQKNTGLSLINFSLDTSYVYELSGNYSFADIIANDATNITIDIDWGFPNEITLGFKNTSRYNIGTSVENYDTFDAFKGTRDKPTPPSYTLPCTWIASTNPSKKSVDLTGLNFGGNDGKTLTEIDDGLFYGSEITLTLSNGTI